MKIDFVFLQQLVRDISRTELLTRFAEVQGEIKHDGSVVTAADLAMQSRMQEALAKNWPAIDFCGEEMAKEEHDRLAATSRGALWCLDPLDGTSNYAASIPFFSVSLALLENNRPELAIVYDPVRDEMFSGVRGGGAWLNGEVLQCQRHAHLPIERCIAVVDFKRLDERLAARLSTRPPYASQRNFGSSALDWCWLARGRFQIYLHGGQKLWDYAAGALILQEAGGYFSTLDGEPVFASTFEPRSVVAATNSELFQLWSTWLQAE